MSIRHRVLAVDDNPRNLAILERALGDAYDLVTCGSGDEALEIASRFRPDVALLDIMMPGIDGFATCRRFRAMRSLAACKIIMLSAKASADDRLEGYRCGADDYITKPFDLDELLAKLRVYTRLKSVEEVDRLKSDLLLLLGHETRTPLSSVLMPVDMLLSDPTLQDGHRSLVEVIERGGKRLLSLIERVAYLSELKSGTVPRQAMKHDPSALIEAVIASLARSHGDTLLASGRVSIEGADAAHGNTALAVVVDRAQVSLALHALLDNALRLSPPTTTVRVLLGRRGPWCEIAVQDQGPGISPVFVDRIFEEFVVEHLKHHSRGHGLSLATARLICEQHGGELTVQTELGAGTTFTIRLPADDGAECAA